MYVNKDNMARFMIEKNIYWNINRSKYSDVPITWTFLLSVVLQKYSVQPN